ncbi:putative cinnamoyl-CoA reductase [Thozetella sp. PMI_491]|nr:putative cinnamoyl-CoA reductase [Thozetella sp. PMI_491]
MAATILLTGATGLIGFRILRAALAAGHNVRCAVRSEGGAQRVSSNSTVQSLAPGDRLRFIVIPDLTVVGAFDSALEGVTHIIHAGAPVPVPGYDPITQVFEPTVKISESLLASALKTPSVRRVVITSSVAANLGTYPSPTTVVTASTRLPLPSADQKTFDSLFDAYVAAKTVELYSTDAFMKEHKPAFTVARVMPGYVFGRNPLMLDANMMQTQNSSNNFLVMCMVGAELPFPIYGIFAHIDDVADVHLRAAFLEPPPGTIQDFGVVTKVDFKIAFDHVEKTFPKAVEEGVLKRGTVPTMPVEYDSGAIEDLLGRELKNFEAAVVEVAEQYLEVIGKEKA